MLSSLIELFERDLQKVADELDCYEPASDIWRISGQVNNSPGNLTLHLCGNLQHFIGAVLGQSGYVRQRDLEFSLKDLSRDELKRRLAETGVIVRETLSTLDSAQLPQPYPIEKNGRIVSTEYLLLQLLTHLNYHLGQISYHRRMIQHPGNVAG